MEIFFRLATVLPQIKTSLTQIEFIRTEHSRYYSNLRVGNRVLGERDDNAFRLIKSNLQLRVHVECISIIPTSTGGDPLLPGSSK